MIETFIKSKIISIKSIIYEWFEHNSNIIYLLSVVAVLAYGFELFNLNLTIDEELHAAFSGPTTAWISQGRWGMFILNSYLLPQTVLPFVPLFLALTFHIMGIVLLLNSWEVGSRLEQGIIGAVSLTFPGIAFLYTFSTINYGIGFGLLCIGISAFLFSQNNFGKKIIAIIPATFAISIYQGFIVALLSVFVIYFLRKMICFGQLKRNELALSFFVTFSALLLYYFIQRVILSTGFVNSSTYVQTYFDISSLLEHYEAVIVRTFTFAQKVYIGDRSLFGTDVTALKFLLIWSIIGIVFFVMRSTLTVMGKIIACALSVALLALPFMSGLFMGGYLAMRFLIALPVSLPGLLMLAMSGSNSKIIKPLVIPIGIICVFQFTTSINILFASSHLTLEADRLLASELIMGIENSKSEAIEEEQIRYVEIVGFIQRKPSTLLPKVETFGGSFFAWDQGNVNRIMAFLNTLGYDLVKPLPVERRIEMVEISNSMPTWPEVGSIRVVDDTVVVKFGPYSNSQKIRICNTKSDENINLYQNFCN